MKFGRKTSIWTSAIITAFVVGTAILTGNSALFVLAGLTATTAIMAARKSAG